jgi:4'-phosphopantetheinyl transferase EntD
MRLKTRSASHFWRQGECKLENGKRAAMTQTTDITQEIVFKLWDWFGDSAGISVRRVDGDCPCLPEEAAYICSAPPSRREEFLTGRWCARAALLQLGVPPSPIGVGSRRQPLWPPGVVGSISHDAGIAAAVVAQAKGCGGIGIDLLEHESASRALSEAAGVIASGDEERAARVATSGLVDPRALVFSIKESVIKAISPSLRRLVDFREINVEVRPGSFESFSAAEGLWLRGRWQVLGKLIISAVVG